MALRMGLIALAVLALAAPAETAGWLAGAQRSEREVVFVVDGSGSMGLDCHPQAAHEWVRERLGELSPNDSVAVVRAGAQSRLVAPFDDRSGCRRFHASVAAASARRLRWPRRHRDRL